MKHWFKYQFGYVNIDSENLFLTKTGNWSETKELEERAKRSFATFVKFNPKPVVFLVVVFSLAIFLVLRRGIDQASLIGFALVAGTLIYNAYEYLRTDIGNRFRIPLEKITEISFPSDRIAELRFSNRDNNPDSCRLTGLNAEAKETLVKILDPVSRNSLHKEANFTNQ